MTFILHSNDIHMTALIACCTLEVIDS